MKTWLPQQQLFDAQMIFSLVDTAFRIIQNVLYD